MFRHTFLVVISLFAMSCFSAMNELKIPNPRSNYDISHDYYTKLITLALASGAPNQPVPKLVQTFPMQQGRAFFELQRGENIDMFWMGTDRKKESELNAVRIPLERGLMGFRRFIIHRDNVEKFDRISNVDQLKKMVACQGTHWPDSQILKQAGLPVEVSPVYEHHFDKLSAKRCDYFPRGFHEGIAEIEQRKHLYPELILYQRIVLYYPFTVYAFFRPNLEHMANRLAVGLNKMMEDGSLQKHMASHPLTAHVFPLSQWQNATVFKIDNRNISASTIEKNKLYWLHPGEGGKVFSEHAHSD